MSHPAAALAPLEPRSTLRDRFGRETWIGVGLTVVAALVYWFSNRSFDAQHGDFFYLADAFLHGHAAIDISAIPPGAITGQDIIPAGARFYVPFGPFPAIALMPLVAIIGAGDRRSL